MALREGAGDIEAAGGRVVAVTQGDPKQAQSLCDRFDVAFPCLADPKLETYKAFDLKRGSAAEVMGPSTWLRGLDAARKGHFVERPQGDPFQLPGTFIIDRKGIVRYAKYARHSADHPKTAELVEALRAMASDSR